jgi:CBS domain-containing protein
MTPADADDVALLGERARLLSRTDPFRGLEHEALEHIVACCTERTAAKGQAVLVEGGEPGSELYVVLDGTLDVAHKDVVVDVVVRGQVFGHPTLLTGLAPEFTLRARETCRLLVIPHDIALGLLSREEGVRFVAGTLRERLIQAARTMRSLPDVRMRPITSLLHGPPVTCTPDTTVAAAARLMAENSLSALLITAGDGLGIVTDVDLRDKVVAAGASGDTPVSAIMSTPVHTVSAELLAPQATLEMMAAGVNHLPAVDASGGIVGMVSASDLMTLDALSPFAVRQSVLAARDEDELAQIAATFPSLFVDLIDARLDAATVTRVVTLLSDALTSTLIELSFARHGRPPVPFAWMALGSTARSELTLASDQDNGLAYADSDDPDVADYFRIIASAVNEGLARCGFPRDSSVVADNASWRMPASGWVEAFASCMRGWDTDHLLAAAIGFDFRPVTGDLDILPPLADVIRDAPNHRRFLSGLADLGAEIPSPLGFRGRLTGPIDIKKSGLLPIQNLARYFAFAKGLAAPTTLERLQALEDSGGEGSDIAESLRDVYTEMAHLQLRHHANAIRAGRKPDNAIDTAKLRPATRVSLQEALRALAAVQKRLPQQIPPR